MPSVILRDLGLSQNYQTVYHAMQQFTEQRDQTTADEVWLVEHPPVFTQGLNGKPEHVLNPHAIPIVQIDRGGQVTYHGPGQQVIYVLLDLRRRKLHLRQVVSALEQCMIDCLAAYGIKATAKACAPGVYIDDKKIGSVGLRIRRGACYHGLAFNRQMDLTPFSYINPCGYDNLTMTQLSDYIDDIDPSNVQQQLIQSLFTHLGLER